MLWSGAGGFDLVDDPLHSDCSFLFYFEEVAFLLDLDEEFQILLEDSKRVQVLDIIVLVRETEEFIVSSGFTG